MRLRPAQRRLLAIVFLEPGRDLDREVLIDRMWGEDPPHTARATLQMHISAIRNTARELVVTTPSGYRAGDAVDDRSVVVELMHEVEDATAAEAWPRVLDLSARGLAAWRGMPFAELAEDPWAAAEIQRLVDLRGQLVDRRAHALLETGDHAALAALAREEIARDPLRETGWQQLMLALQGAGRPADALRVFEQARRVLAEELGIEPGLALRALEERIRYPDMGTSESPREQVPNNLPSPGTSFVGREDDLAAIESLLNEARVVTITGGPGVGKTRLAIEFGEAVLDRYPEGAWFVSLAPSRSARDVTSSILTGTRTQHPSVGPDDLARALVPRQALLILDNCEHVLGPVAAFLDAVAALDGPLRVLVTSRRPMGDTDTATWNAEPLPVPTLADESDGGPTSLASPALRLFVDRARAVDRSFRLLPETMPLVSEVCRGTSGIPLAIELAASWLPAIAVADLPRVFGPELGWRDDGAAELVPHASLAAAIERSTELLPTDDRQLLHHVSIFGGPFELTDAHVVCAPSGDLRTVAAGIARLVDASLLVVERRPHGRAAYRMLVPIREHLRNGASRAINEAMRVAFVDHYLAKAQAWCPDPLAQGTDFAGMDDDIDNVRATLGLALEDGRTDDVSRAVCALAGYFYDRYLAWEGREWLTKVVNDVADLPARVQAYRMLGAFAQNTDDLQTARQYLARAVWLARAIDDPYSMATCLPSVAQIHIDRGRWVASQRVAERALRLLGPGGTAAGRAIATYYRGEALANAGRVREAVPVLLDAARLWRESGQVHRTSYALSSLTMFAVLAGLQAPAQRHATTGLQLARNGGSDYRLVRALAAAAATEAAWGDPAASQALLVEDHAHLGPSEVSMAIDFLLPSGFLLRRIGREDWLIPMLREAEAVFARFDITLSDPWIQVIAGWRRDAERRGVKEARLGLSNGPDAMQLASRTLAVITAGMP